MSFKSTFWMAAGAAALGSFAYFANQNRASATAPEATTALFPSLREQLNDADRLSIDAADGPLTFAKVDGAWSLLERGGFPADSVKVGTYLLTLEGAERVERKTSRPERYADLGLDPSSEEGAPTKVTVAAGEQTLADLWVGKRRTTGADTAYYVRVEGEDATWVAGGDLAASPRLADWADTQMIDLERERMLAVRVAHPDGNVVEAARQKDQDSSERMTLLAIPPGQELQSEWVTSRFDGGLSRLTFEDVESAEDAEFDAAQAVKATYWTKHGLAVTLESLPKEGGGLRTRVSAAYDPGGAPGQIAVLPEATAELPDLVSEEEGSGEADESAADEPEEVPPTPEELQAEADGINAQLGGWIYHLSEYKAQALRPTMDELVKDIEPEAEEGAEEGGFGGAGLPNDLNSDLGGTIPPSVFEVDPPAGDGSDNTDGSDDPDGSDGSDGSDDPSDGR